MADISERIANYVSETDIVNPVLSAEFDFEGKRNISFHVRTSAFTGTATADIEIETSNIGGDDLDEDASWKELLPFSTISAPGAFPLTEFLTLIDDGTKKTPGAKGRVSLTLAGTSPDFSAEIYMGYDVGVTE